MGFLSSIEDMLAAVYRVRNGLTRGRSHGKSPRFDGHPITRRYPGLWTAGMYGNSDIVQCSTVSDAYLWWTVRDAFVPLDLTMPLAGAVAWGPAREVQ